MSAELTHGAAVALLLFGAPSLVHAQRRAPLTDEQKMERAALEDELQEIAVIERKLMIPMRDGVRIATDIYRPRSASGKVPIIWSRTPYNFNYWDVRNGVPIDAHDHRGTETGRHLAALVRRAVS